MLVKQILEKSDEKETAEERIIPKEVRDELEMLQHSLMDYKILDENFADLPEEIKNNREKLKEFINEWFDKLPDNLKEKRNRSIELNGKYRPLVNAEHERLESEIIILEEQLLNNFTDNEIAEFSNSFVGVSDSLEEKVNKTEKILGKLTGEEKHAFAVLLASVIVSEENLKAREYLQALVRHEEINLILATSELFFKSLTSVFDKNIA